MQMDFSALGTVPSDRKPRCLPQGVGATSQHVASQAGLAALRQGGNAVDAALAAAITLTVVEPTSCEVGGDLFALVWDGSRLHGLNGSGRAPARLTPQEVRRRGYDELPAEGWLSVTVPGAPAAWAELHQRFGRLPFAALFAAAIAYAEAGLPLPPTVFLLWRVGVDGDHHLGRLRAGHLARRISRALQPANRGNEAGVRRCSPYHRRSGAGQRADRRAALEGVCGAAARPDRQTGAAG